MISIHTQMSNKKTTKKGAGFWAKFCCFNSDLGAVHKVRHGFFQDFWPPLSPMSHFRHDQANPLPKNYVTPVDPPPPLID